MRRLNDARQSAFDDDPPDPSKLRMDPPPARRKIVGAIQRTSAASSPTPSSSSSNTTRPIRPPLASPSSSSSLTRSRNQTSSSGAPVKARVKVSTVATLDAPGGGGGLAPRLPVSPSTGGSFNWSDGGSDVGSAVGTGASSRRAPSPISSYVSTTTRSAASSSPRVATATAGGASVRPAQVHARSSPAAPSGARVGGSIVRHARSNSSGLAPVLSPASGAVLRSATHIPPATHAASTPTSRPLNASVRSSPAALRAPPASSAPSTPFFQAQQQQRPIHVASPNDLSSAASAGAESPPKYFSQLRHASIPPDREGSYSPLPSLAPLPLSPPPLLEVTPVRPHQPRRSSASSLSSDSPDSRFSGSTTSQPYSASSFSSVSYAPPSAAAAAAAAASPAQQPGLQSIPSSSYLAATADVGRSPQETIKPSLAEEEEGDATPANEVDLEAKQEKEDAKVNRKIADLEISNASLLAINHTLEAAKARQAREIRDLRRRFRSGTNLPPPLSRSATSHPSGGRSRSSSHSSHASSHSEATSDDDEEDDPQFERMKETLLSMLEKGVGALAVAVPEPSGWGGGVGGGGAGGRVLGILEVGEWHAKEGGEEAEGEEEDGDETPSPGLDAQSRAQVNGAGSDGA